MTTWVTKKITIDPSVTEFNKKFLELTRDIKSLNVQGRMQAAYDKHKAFPYLTIIEVSLPLAGRAERAEMKVKKVSYEKIDPSVFAIPSGYKKLTVPPMLPQQ